MRGRTTLVGIVLVFVALAVTGVALVASQRNTLTDNVDELLDRQSAVVAKSVDGRQLTQVIAGQGDDEAFAQVIDSSGRVIAATSNAPATLDLPLPTTDQPTYSSGSVPGKDVEFRIRSARHGNVMIRNATPLDEVNNSADSLTRGLSVAVPATTLMCGGLVWLLVGRVLRPVEQIRRQVAEISGSSLDRRVPQPRARDEIGRLAHTMNEMLGRLEGSASRQQRFVADASHELRSPLARMRTELEVDIAQPQTADPAATQQSLLEEIDTLQRMVDDLLLLARSDSAVVIQGEPVDLDDVVMREVQFMRASRPLAIDTSGVSAAQVVGNSAHLSRVVRNLLENAEQHGGSSVVVSLTESEGDAVLGVADDGEGIPTHLHEQVFERFARLDEARAGSNGTGLGLAIAREIVTACGGTLVIDPAHQPGARFVMRLPCL